MRGLYNQNEGNETRSSQHVFEDYLRDNEICEGEWVDRMIKFAKLGDMDSLVKVRNEMKEWGIRGGVSRCLSQERADSCLRQALIHLKLKKKK
jgi:hypothetical protein